MVCSTFGNVNWKASTVRRARKSEYLWHSVSALGSDVYVLLFVSERTNLHISDVELELPARIVFLNKVIENWNSSFCTDWTHLKVGKFLWNCPVWLASKENLKHVMRDNWGVLVHRYNRLCLIWWRQTNISDTENILQHYVSNSYGVHFVVGLILACSSDVVSVLLNLLIAR